MKPRHAAFGAAAVTAAAWACSKALVVHRQNTRPAPLVAFAAGGTGGHVYPALALAEELQQRGVQACFFGEAEGLESALAQKEGFDFYAVPTVDLQRPLRSHRNVWAMLRLPGIVLRSVAALLHASPDLVLGTGGHVAFPTCAAALVLGIPLWVHESNAQPGVANVVISAVAERTLLAHASGAHGVWHTSRCTVVGTPVRQSVLRHVGSRRNAARRALRVRGRGPVLLLVLGGSLGCGYLNAALNNALPELLTVPGLHILWQTGKRQHCAYANGYAAGNRRVRVVPYIEDMGQALAGADLVLGRAGAATCAELMATRTPALLVPSPAVSEDHQTANAIALADLGVAQCLPQAEVDAGELATCLLPLLARNWAGQQAGTGAKHGGSSIADRGSAALSSGGGRGSCSKRGRRSSRADALQAMAAAYERLERQQQQQQQQAGQGPPYTSKRDEGVHAGSSGLDCSSSSSMGTPVGPAGVRQATAHIADMMIQRMGRRCT